MYTFPQWISLAMTAALLVAAVLLVRRDYRAGEALAPVTVVAVWAAYLVHVAVTVWFAWAAPLGRMEVPARPAHLVGAFVAGFGTAVAADAIATFASLERMSGMDTSELVTEGIYRYSRNPQNVGWALALLGVGIAGRSPSALGLVGLFLVVIHVYLVWLEEPHLQTIFGEEYRLYCERTPRYLGLPSEGGR